MDPGRGSRLTCTHVTAQTGPNPRIRCTDGLSDAPETAPRPFLALSHCPNRGAPLPDHDRARHRAPSPPPDHTRQPPDSKSRKAQKKRIGSRLRVDSASREHGDHGCSGSARPGRPRTALQLVSLSASGPSSKSGLRARGAKRGVGSVAGSREGAGRAQFHPQVRKPAPYRPYPHSRNLTDHPGRGVRGVWAGKTECSMPAPASWIVLPT